MIFVRILSRESHKIPNPCEIWNWINNSSDWPSPLTGIWIFTWLLTDADPALIEIKSSWDTYSACWPQFAPSSVSSRLAVTDTPNKTNSPLVLGWTPFYHGYLKKELSVLTKQGSANVWSRISFYKSETAMLETQ